MRLGENEPDFGPWRVAALRTVADSLLRAAGEPVGRPRVLALDGRSSSGKTTLARRLERSVAGAVTVHTDDIAWWHSPFGWADLLAGGVLEPVHAGEPVAYRPPAWTERGRAGAIVVPPGAPLLIVEGVGAGRREVAHLIDAVVWVQSDLDVTDRRNQVRVAAGEITPSAFAGWMGEEIAFVAGQRAWERAVAVVAGTPELAHDPATELVIADRGRPVRPSSRAPG